MSLGRDTIVDIIFMVWQLTEKVIEHNTKPCFVFVNLHKAYDSVLLVALWIALRKLGVPEDVIKLVKSFQEDKKARVRVDGELEIKVTNVRQGCKLAPTLFNIYMLALLLSAGWTGSGQYVEGVSTLMIIKQDAYGLLFWRSTRYANRTMMYKGEFADDVVVVLLT